MTASIGRSGNAAFSPYPLMRSDGSGVRIEAGSVFQFTTTHTSPEALTRAFHTHEVHRTFETLPLIDAGQRGLGSASCGPDTAGRRNLLQRARLPHRGELVSKATTPAGLELAPLLRDECGARFPLSSEIF